MTVNKSTRSSFMHKYQPIEINSLSLKISHKPLIVIIILGQANFRHPQRHLVKKMKIIRVNFLFVISKKGKLLIPPITRTIEHKLTRVLCCIRKSNSRKSANCMVSCCFFYNFFFFLLCIFDRTSYIFFG